MKENLLRVRRLLERKCFGADEACEGFVEPYLDIVESIDNDGAFNHVQEYINGIREYCERNGISYDEIEVSLRFGFYFDSRYESRSSYTIENRTKPIQDLLHVYVNSVGYISNGVYSSVDYDEISEYQDFVITFDDFKALLEESGLSLSISSFEDVLENYRNYNPTVCKISKGNSKLKKLLKD